MCHNIFVPPPEGGDTKILYYSLDPPPPPLWKGGLCLRSYIDKLLVKLQCIAADSDFKLLLFVYLAVVSYLRVTTNISGFGN